MILVYPSTRIAGTTRNSHKQTSWLLPFQTKRYCFRSKRKILGVLQLHYFLQNLIPAKQFVQDLFSLCLTCLWDQLGEHCEPKDKEDFPSTWKALGIFSLFVSLHVLLYHSYDMVDLSLGKLLWFENLVVEQKWTPMFLQHVGNFQNEAWPA